jgi:hypothetical protein
LSLILSFAYHGILSSSVCWRLGIETDRAGSIQNCSNKKINPIYIFLQVEKSTVTDSQAMLHIKFPMVRSMPPVE